MAIGDPPTILALDFDGVLCEGAREYFEASRRTYERVWPESTQPSEGLLPEFRDLRPVIETGWEMPVLVKALVVGIAKNIIHERWGVTRDALLARDPRGRDVLVAMLKTTLDQVRYEWIRTDRTDWLFHHALYCDVDDVRRVLRTPARTVILTTKEGEFTRQLLDHWAITVGDIQGKEAGNHKCENLRELRAAYTADVGTIPTVWLVEDRLETLQCVRRHGDLDDVQLFLATWGYNTPRTWQAARRDPGIKLLTLSEFTAPFSHWGTSG